MIVLDTNVISEAMSTSPNQTFSVWLSNQPSRDLFTTSISLGEIFYGIELFPLGNRRTQLLSRAEEMFAKLFTGRMLVFDELAARAFAAIAFLRRQRGRPISIFDAQIAAIAHANRATLATRNTADFDGCGIHIVNPWVD